MDQQITVSGVSENIAPQPTQPVIHFTDYQSEHGTHLVCRRYWAHPTGYIPPGLRGKNLYPTGDNSLFTDKKELTTCPGCKKVLEEKKQ